MCFKSSAQHYFFWSIFKQKIARKNWGPSSCVHMSDTANWPQVTGAFVCKATNSQLSHTHTLIFVIYIYICGDVKGVGVTGDSELKYIGLIQSIKTNPNVVQFL